MEYRIKRVNIIKNWDRFMDRPNSTADMILTGALVMSWKCTFLLEVEKGDVKRIFRLIFRQIDNSRLEAHYCKEHKDDNNALHFKMFVDHKTRFEIEQRATKYLIESHKELEREFKRREYMNILSENLEELQLNYQDNNLSWKSFVQEPFNDVSELEGIKNFKAKIYQDFYDELDSLVDAESGFYGELKTVLTGYMAETFRMFGLLKMKKIERINVNKVAA